MVTAEKTVKQFKCSDVMKTCNFMVQADSEEEVLEAAARHAARDHGITTMDENLKAKVKSAIKDVKPQR